MFCPKCGEQISVREEEDAVKIRRLREILVRIQGTAVLGHGHNSVVVDRILEECE